MQAVSIFGLAVETQSGTTLGKVTGVEVDPESQAVQRYQVSRGNMLARLVEGMPAQLLVDPAQVVSITEEKMVVVDLVAAEPAAAAVE